MVDWILERDQVHAIRDAREALRIAAFGGQAPLIDEALVAAIRVMVEAQFTRATICSLVAAAIDSGLPRVRSQTRRAAMVQHWAERAAVLVDDVLNETLGTGHA